MLAMASDGLIAVAPLGLARRMATAGSRSVALLLPLRLLELLLLGPELMEVLLWLLEPVLVLLHHNRSALLVCRQWPAVSVLLHHSMSALLVCRQWPAVPAALCEISNGLGSPPISQPAAKSAKKASDLPSATTPGTPSTSSLDTSLDRRCHLEHPP